MLVTAGVLTDAELVEALDAQRSIIGSRRRLGHVLVDLGLATEQQIAEALGDQLGLDVVDLSKVALSPESVRLLPRGVAQRLGMIVLARDGNRLTVAVTDPTDVVALDDVRLHTGADRPHRPWSRPRPRCASTWCASGRSPRTRRTPRRTSTRSMSPHRISMRSARDDDAPTVRLVSLVLADAVRAGASDIHVEPQRDTLRVRYRVDGVLRDVMSAPRNAMASVVSRLKIVSGLDIAERRLPQDGRTRITVDGQQIDARVGDDALDPRREGRHPAADPRRAGARPRRPRPRARPACRPAARAHQPCRAWS